ncbi:MULTISPECIES: MDR family MFS transporter [Amycolatopsis]|uniref:Putative membrane protein n=1 Tax=Amycolatopsis japonica TaxID=208439 RepID=A0A075UR86_9PSEU|nr:MULTISPECIES: MFS transporter [Amycolatopsis]AIG74891.1 Putative membrane protein [Amycolatopsis japonica]OKJ89863.1 MFS transporter [Amycolatopsis sp. CB00013]
MATADLLGLPSTRGRFPLIAAQSVDALGTGLFLPFAVVYFHAAKGLSLTAVGAALSIAALIALPSGPLAGRLIDRFGPGRMVITANLIRAVTFTGYVFADEAWHLVVLAAVTFWGEGMFWPSTGALVAQVADDGQRARWYAMERALRNVGIGLGGLLGAAMVAWGGTAGYTAIVLVNAASFVVAAVLVASWRAPAGTPRETEPEAAPAGGYRKVFADRIFRGVLVTVFVFALCDLALTVLLSAYVLDGLKLPAWQPGVLFTVNTVLIVLAQTVVSRRVERRSMPRTLRLSAAVWAISFALFALVPTGESTAAFLVLALAMIVFTCAELLQAPTSSALTVAIAPARLRGRYLGLEELVWSAARVIAPAMFTWLLSHGPALPWLVLIGFCGVAIVVLGRLNRAL